MKLLLFIDLAMHIALGILEIYCFYKFCIGKKSKNETLYYGIFTVILLLSFR